MQPRSRMLAYHLGCEARIRRACASVRNSLLICGGLTIAGGSSIHSCILRPRDGPIPSSSVRDRFASTKSYASSGHKSALRAARRSACCKCPLACSASRAKSSAIAAFSSEGFLFPTGDLRTRPGCCSCCCRSPRADDLSAGVLIIPFAFETLPPASAVNKEPPAKNFDGKLIFFG
jgi:hypothetical protein